MDPMQQAPRAERSAADTARVATPGRPEPRPSSERTYGQPADPAPASGTGTPPAAAAGGDSGTDSAADSGVPQGADSGGDNTGRVEDPGEAPAAIPVRLVSAPPHAGTHALFVDVGYVYAAIGLLVAGTAERRAFRVDAEFLISSLIDEARVVFPEGRLLRVYWYDGARNRVPTFEQKQVAELPDVKVRLGNLNAHNQQKGVDSLIRSDLESLARNRAIEDAVVVSGDEDLVLAVETAQSYGVRVHLWGIEPAYGMNQAEPLVWEADVTRTLHHDFCAPCIFQQPPVTAAPTVTPNPQRATGGTPPTFDQVWRLGGKIAERWLSARGREDMAGLMPGPRLPENVDKALLVDAEGELQFSLRPHEDLRRALRNGFWDRLNQEFGVTPHGEG
ncbi:NYN domain-containing protein [Streptomycetaceae bacterium NBC_01309]